MSDIEEITHDEGSVTWRAGILPKHGGHCVQLSAETKGRVLHIFEPADVQAVLDKPTSYGCPILFPYANRVRDESFVWRGKRYTVPFARHGIVRTRKWIVTQREPSLVRLAMLLKPEEGTSHFPWLCRCGVTYELCRNGLNISFRAKNFGQAFPFTLGFHPYFFANWMMPVKVHLPVRESWELDEEFFPTGKIRERYENGCNTDLDGYSAYDHLYGGVTPLKSGSGDGHCHYHHHQDGEDVGICISFNSGEFPFVCFYTPPDRNAMCIEPYTGATNALNHIDDSVWRSKILHTNGEISYTVRIGLTSME